MRLAPLNLPHLVKRFLGSLRPGGPTREDDRWARSVLGEGEAALWARMSGSDRRHAVAVARRAERGLGENAERALVAAALLHDVGKVEADLGTLGRVVATVARAAGGPAIAHRLPRAMALYLGHDRLGAELLSRAGSDPRTVAWAAEHHLPSERWSLPPAVGAALKAADDD